MPGGQRQKRSWRTQSSGMRLATQALTSPASLGGQNRNSALAYPSTSTHKAQPCHTRLTTLYLASPSPITLMYLPSLETASASGPPCSLGQAPSHPNILHLAWPSPPAGLHYAEYPSAWCSLRPSTWPRNTHVSLCQVPWLSPIMYPLCQCPCIPPPGTIQARGHRTQVSLCLAQPIPQPHHVHITQPLAKAHVSLHLAQAMC